MSCALPEAPVRAPGEINPGTCMAPAENANVAFALGEARAFPPRQTRPWRVLHACDAYERISPVVEAESAAGMLPAVVTRGLPASQGAAQISLLQACSSVRNWRRRLLESAADCELVHAHCFSAGMAAVRIFPIVVYEIDRFVEDVPKPSHGRSWLSRSFRAAEQFIISHAAAVVARTPSLRQELVRRGAAEEHVFVIPRPLAPPEPFTYAAEDAGDLEWRHFGDDSGGASRFAPENSAGGRIFAVFSSVAVGNDWRPWLQALVAALRSAARRGQHLRLYLQAENELHDEALRVATGKAGFDVQVVDRQAAAGVLPASSLVIAGATARSAITSGNPLALAALAAGKPLLAADLPCNRDVTPSGRGCLWFKPENVADLERRLLFLAANPALCAALAASGARYLRETRSPLRIAEQYDAVYRYAQQRRHSGKSQTPLVRWQPSQACI